MKEGGTIILAVVMLLPPAPCPGDDMFRCESETNLFGLPKEGTTRNQWLSCIYNTVTERLGYVRNPRSLMEGTETICRDDIGDLPGSPEHL